MEVAFTLHTAWATFNTQIFNGFARIARNMRGEASHIKSETKLHPIKVLQTFESAHKFEIKPFCKIVERRYSELNSGEQDRLTC